MNGVGVHEIHADLTSGEADLTSAFALRQNEHLGFNGISKKGKFEISGDIARDWLRAPLNPNGRPNSDVVKPWINGLDVTRRPLDNWIIDFEERSQAESVAYELPFEWLRRTVRKTREKSRSKAEKRDWWLLARRAPAMKKALHGLARFIVVPEVSQHRLFIWMPIGIVPDKNVVVLAKDDETTFGILLSRFHVQWSLRQGTSLENRPRYTSKTTVRTFPFPEGLTPNIPAASYANDPRAITIAVAAKQLDELRQAWLNPRDLVKIVPEVVPGYPDRILPVDAAAEKILKTRTLTNLYNEKPAWLVNAHRDLDAAVAAAYGWPTDISEEDALARLLALNHARAQIAPPPKGSPRKKDATPLAKLGGSEPCITAPRRRRNSATEQTPRDRR